MISCLIADDLSGALEAGAAYRARGWRVTLSLVDEAPAASEGQLCAFTSETRDLPPAAAGSRLRELLGGWRERGADLLFKKIDSTLRGPVGAELLALSEVLAPPLIVLCPANPAVGRTVRNGELFVNGVPLAQTDFAGDAIWPSTTSSVQELLHQQGLRGAVRLKLDDLRAGFAAPVVSAALASPHRVMFSDAETTADLTALVQAVRALVPAAVFVGAGALAAVLAADSASPVAHPPAAPAVDLRWLMLCGSRHEASRRQLDHLARHTGFPVRQVIVGRSSLEPEIDATVEALKDHRAVAVGFGAEGGSATENARLLLEAVEQFVIGFHRRSRDVAYFLTGGETAWTACQALQGRWLEIDHEVEPGVVAGTLHPTSGKPVPIMTKPGGFGNESLLARLVNG